MEPSRRQTSKSDVLLAPNLAIGCVRRLGRRDTYVFNLVRLSALASRKVRESDEAISALFIAFRGVPRQRLQYYMSFATRLAVKCAGRLCIS
ncbi:hypothetical protein T440DRAFT_151721 [Plenodomus tracheiphilus IPT5]|uniref:Uncharacterized protein n=1 Tax=Plenodomus tracheiphilus IPT5 TaxID=1408161 RepID=A0A6A7AZL6_9PLEO|nr:hypothetical protein T440DRAFT_151721 [Plenodomus tracheiphilus IPT5]